MNSAVQVIGEIWQPGVGTCAMRYPLSAYDVENVKGYAAAYETDLRGGLEQWLACHAGDFSNVLDFAGHIGEEYVEWGSEDSETTYYDAMYGEED